MALFHSVALSWAGSKSPNIIGYNVYRASASGGPYTQIGFVGGTSYLDAAVTAGQTYFYTATAVDTKNRESHYAAQAVAVIPIP
jgi:fibronectin type 3 domain-containing protein